jgi:hypothetical protein
LPRVDTAFHGSRGVAFKQSVLFALEEPGRDMRHLRAVFGKIYFREEI